MKNFIKLALLFLTILFTLNVSAYEENTQNQSSFLGGDFTGWLEFGNERMFRGNSETQNSDILSLQGLLTWTHADTGFYLGYWAATNKFDIAPDINAESGPYLGKLGTTKIGRMEFNYNIFVVSNQSGIARGYYTDNDVKKLHNYLRDTLEKKQIFINKIYYSPYHKDGIIKKYIKNSSCRKPGIKLFSTLSKEWGIKNKSKIIMIGDQASDIEFAKNAKIKSALFKKGNLYNFIKKLGLSEKI